MTRSNIPLEYARRLLSERGDEQLRQATAEALSRSTGCTIAEADSAIKAEERRRG